MKNSYFSKANKSIGKLIIAAPLIIGLCQIQCNSTDGTSGAASELCAVKLEGEILMGALLGTTGPWPIGANFEKSILMAIDDINNNGGIKGKNVGLVTCETEGDGTVGIRALQEMVEDYEIGGVVGPMRSAVAIPLTPIAKEAKILLISPGVSSPELTTINDDGYFYRTCPHDGLNGTVDAIVANGRGFQKAFIISREDPYTTGLGQAFIDKFSEYGQTSQTSYTLEESDYAVRVIQEAMEYEPDVIYMSSTVVDGKSIAIQASNTTWPNDEEPDWIYVAVLTGNDFYGQVDTAYLEGTKEGTKLKRGTAPRLGPLSEEYETRFDSNWGEQPEPWSINAYDAAFVLAIAMEMADDPKNGTNIRDALANIVKKQEGITTINPNEWEKVVSTVAQAGTLDYEGYSGPIDFDEHGDVVSNQFREFYFSGGGVEYCGCWDPLNEVPCSEIDDSLPGSCYDTTP